MEAGGKYRFNEDGSEMTLLEVAKLDEGEYTCIAKNKAGESEQELSLRVFGEQRRSGGFDAPHVEPRSKSVGGGGIIVCFVRD